MSEDALGFPEMRIVGPIGLLALLTLLMSGAFRPTGRQSRVANRIGRRPGTASSFYVDSAHGSDSKRGTSPREPWRTLARVGSGGYRGGDTILLRGGERFEGTICVGRTNVSASARRSGLTIRS